MNKKNEMKKVDVIYVRVSTKEQVQGFSLESQEKVCREYSAKSGHVVLQVFKEEGESAKTTDRTELQKMVRFCEKHKNKIGRVVFYNVSRMSRDTADYHVLKVLLKKYGISVVSATEGFDDSPSGKLHETILSAFAQFDNDVRSVKTIEGMKARLLKGLWSNIAPFGYKNIRDTLDHKIIAPDPDKSPIVKMLFEKYSTGKYTLPELASLANKMGMKSMHGKKISKQLVAKIISNPIHYGMMVVPKFDIAVMGLHEPIITEGLFRQAQDVRNGIIGKKLPRNKDNKDYPLRGIKCGGCGKSISGGKTRSKTGKYYQYYACFNPNCSKRGSIKKDDLEKDFSNFLLELTPNNDFFDVLKEAIKLAHKSELQSVTSLEKKLNARIAGLKEDKEKLLNIRIAEEISTEDFMLTNEKYKIQIAELEKDLASLSSPELGVDSMIESGIEFLKHLPENWKSLDVKDLRVLRTLLFPENLLYTYPNIKTPELCCIYNIKSEFRDEGNRFVTLRGVEPRFQP